MTYKETLDWMFAQLPMYQQKGASAFKGKLDNIKLLASHLKNPENKFRSVHVAGTNGKGSSSHMLASVLQEAGYKVGLYTSPHLKDYRERIKIDGKPISKKYVMGFVEQNMAFLKEYKLSFFEMSVGMAFDYFAKKKVDIAIVEVGLGGRLDSTNILFPEVSLITNIGYDHMDMLGDTIEKITFEKAGVIKDNVPVVVSEYQEETAEIFKNIAKERNSTIVFASKESKTQYKTSLLGNYQTKNVKGVVATLKELREFKVTDHHIKNGLKNVVSNTGLMGRWQILNKNPFVVCDTAHNKEGLSIVLEQISKQEYNSLHIVLGFVKDKKLESVLPLFPKEAIYYFCTPNIPRGLDVDELLHKANEHNLKGKKYSSVQEAFKEALQCAAAADFVYIGGSTFVVAEVV
ncbi:dihydrofolate synthase/folylpolyglutamate synthase [Saonia flava]|uniref:Dihydrofolate synthase/folylpolyglutamate synthase n=1 Tax=Saonia flava TaxID=523696 RepID=A0A846R1K4_9FLAO|nr:folylpolyglutamate synthase/dihydrofolate synthase family protein [Saonia flava]NJB72842.1 dihydrofolate synthase/folylpolyglutamate synthase [Saonia flava]